MSRIVHGGLLVAFEGIDGAGKSTQALAACEQLKHLGYEATYLREPTNGPIGTRLRQLMVHGRVSPMEEFALFRDDRAEDVRLNIRPALDRGAIVCIDRYYISSIAYQGALGIDPQFIQQENEKIAPKPDLILLFELPVEQGQARILRDRPDGHNLFERQEYQQKVRDIFDQLELPGLVRLDASQSQEQLKKEVVNLIVKAASEKSA